MLKPTPLANSLATTIAIFYFGLSLLGLVAPDLFLLVENAQFLGAVAYTSTLAMVDHYQKEFKRERQAIELDPERPRDFSFVSLPLSSQRPLRCPCILPPLPHLANL